MLLHTLKHAYINVHILHIQIYLCIHTQMFHYERLDYSPYAFQIALTDYHLFRPLMQHFQGRRFNKNEIVEMALREWLRMQQSDFCCKSILKLLPK